MALARFTSAVVDPDMIMCGWAYGMLLAIIARPLVVLPVPSVAMSNLHPARMNVQGSCTCTFSISVNRLVVWVSSA